MAVAGLVEGHVDLAVGHRRRVPVVALLPQQLAVHQDALRRELHVGRPLVADVSRELARLSANVHGHRHRVLVRHPSRAGLAAHVHRHPRLRVVQPDLLADCSLLARGDGRIQGGTLRRGRRIQHQTGNRATGSGDGDRMDTRLHLLQRRHADRAHLASQRRGDLHVPGCLHQRVPDGCRRPLLGSTVLVLVRGGPEGTLLGTRHKHRAAVEGGRRAAVEELDPILPRIEEVFAQLLHVADAVELLDHRRQLHFLDKFERGTAGLDLLSEVDAVLQIGHFHSGPVLVGTPLQLRRLRLGLLVEEEHNPGRVGVARLRVAADAVGLDCRVSRLAAIHCGLPAVAHSSLVRRLPAVGQRLPRQHHVPHESNHSLPVVGRLADRLHRDLLLYSVALARGHRHLAVHDLLVLLLVQRVVVDVQHRVEDDLVQLDAHRPLHPDFVGPVQLEDADQPATRRGGAATGDGIRSQLPLDQLQVASRDPVLVVLLQHVLPQGHRVALLQLSATGGGRRVAAAGAGRTATAVSRTTR